MRGRVFFISFLTLFLLAGLTQPALLGPLLATPPLPTAETVWPSPTSTPHPTTDPFAHVPTATPMGYHQAQVIVVQSLPEPLSGEMAPERAVIPVTPTGAPTVLLIPTIVPELATPLPELPTALPPAATSDPTLVVSGSTPPDFLRISRLNLEAPVEPVGMIPSGAGDNIYAWDVPAWRAAGWLNSSAPFGQPGNTVLAGHHNLAGEVFRDLWTLQAGDEIVLESDQRRRAYRVQNVMILPERDQPLAVRLENARHAQPTPDERLTLITCWPYDDNSHRVIVVAAPETDS